MKLKYLIGALAVAAMTSLPASAQDDDLNPWFVQGQLGASYSVGGGAGFGEMLSPAGQLAFGKHFNPYIGARVTVGGWRGRYRIPNSTCTGFYDWHATVDGLWNIFKTFNHEYDQPVSLRFIAGVGFDRAFEKPSSSLLVRLGLSMDVRLCEALDFSLEYQANGVSDRWNGLDDHSFDTFMNLLVGVTYKFGTGYQCKSCVPEPVVQVVNKRTNEMREAQVVEKIVHDTITVVKEVPVKIAEIKREVFFPINVVTVEPDMQKNIAEVADYMKQYPDAKATVMGYADKGTGTAAINLQLAEKRATTVYNELVNRYGIAASRLTKSSMTNQNTQQPYEENALNRVVIMTARM